jgi:uncharacterized membrane protein YhaH (DUF805 family)
MDLTRCQQLLVGHGALVLLWGFVVGFGFLFFLLGEITLWPIPGSVAYQMPGTYDAWRMAHLEGILNGFGLWIVALVLPLVPLESRGRRRLTYAMIVVAWTIVVASTVDPLFPNGRGLKIVANVPNTVAFFLFYVGIVLVFAVVIAIALKTLRPTARRTGGS